MIARRADAHEGPVTDVAWFGSLLVSAGWDGLVRLWSRSLQIEASFVADGPVRYLAAGKNRIIAITDGGTMHILDPEMREGGQLELQTLPSGVALSPDTSRIALVTVEGEALIANVLSLDVRAHKLDHGALSFVRFLSADEVLVGTLAGTLLRIRV